MKDIKLTKVKKLKGVGMEISYNVTEETADASITNKYKTEITEQPSDELLDCFQEFSGYVSETIGLGVEEEEFLETEEVKLMGKGENESLIVKSKYYTDNDLCGTAISPRIRLYNNTFGFEARMQNSWTKLTEEVKAFLFDGKRGELESFN